MRIYGLFATFFLGPLLVLASLWAAWRGRLPREGLVRLDLHPAPIDTPFLLAPRSVRIQACKRA